MTLTSQTIDEKLVPLTWGTTPANWASQGPRKLRKVMGLRDQVMPKRARVMSLAATVALSGTVLPARHAEASELTNISQYNNSLNLANNPMYRWSAAVHRTGSAGTSYASGVLIAPDVYLNAGHFTPINGSLVARHTEIVFGANYNTSTERYSVNRTVRYPGYEFGNPNTIDLGIGYLNRFVDGFATLGTRVTFAAASLNDERLMLVDYGNYGDLNTGELPSLGDRMGGFARTFNLQSSVYPQDRYLSTIFNYSEPLNVSGMNYSSGAPWYNANGDIVGITTAGSIGTGPGFTTSVRLFTPEIQAYLQPIIQDSWARFEASIPSPSAAALLTLGLGMAARCRR